MRYQPLYDRVLVRVLSAGNRTRGGLYVPDMAIDGTPWMRGEIVAVGHGRLMANGEVIPLQVKEGQTVVFFRSQSSGEQLVVPGEDGEDLLVVREPNILAVLHDLPRSTGLVSVDGAELLQ